MRGKVTLVAGLFAVVFALPAGSYAQEAPPAAPAPKEGEVKSAPPAEERTISSRAFDRFEFETATQRGFWAEAGFLYEKTDFKRGEETDIDADLKTYKPFARFAFGGNLWEANLFVPFRSFDGTIAPDKTNASIVDNVSEGGIGDLELSGRFIPLRTALLDAGLGVNFSFPTGDEDDGLGAGEVGALPFVTAALHLGVADARGHIGRRFFTGNNNNLGTATDQLVYGFGIFIPVLDHVVFRNEFTGVQLDRTNNPKVVNYIAGFDIRIPILRWDLLLRPTGLAGITHESPDFGVGLSFAFTSPNFRPGKAGASEYGDIVIE